MEIEQMWIRIIQEMSGNWRGERKLGKQRRRAAWTETGRENSPVPSTHTHPNAQLNCCNFRS